MNQYSCLFSDGFGFINGPTHFAKERKTVRAVVLTPMRRQGIISVSTLQPQPFRLFKRQPEIVSSPS